mgnify:CR=1 FL=1|tara:strand:- start:2422 stop:2631 length:210 start_codon:yes stop_codon:yes gene_type:complete
MSLYRFEVFVLGLLHSTKFQWALDVDDAFEFVDIRASIPAGADVVYDQIEFYDFDEGPDLVWWLEEGQA